MAPRKRAVPSSAGHHPRKRTKQLSLMKSSDSDAANLSSDDDITARNSQESPLLRLPAEIRERIWLFAFGGRILHIHPDGYGLRLSHATYIEPPSDVKIEQAILGPPRPLQPDTQAKLTASRFEHMDAPRFCEFRTELRGLAKRCRNKTLPSPVPLACKQFYYEAMPYLWQYNTFCASSPFALRYAFRISHARLDLVELLSITVHERHLGAWSKLLADDFLTRMSSLKRVRVIINCDESYRMMNEDKWMAYDLQKTGLELVQLDIVRIDDILRPHRGRPHRPVMTWLGPTCPKEYVEHFRNILLQHEPPSGPRHFPPEQLVARRSARLFTQGKR
ncbi:hypothetical protein K491DRAFT_758962 [Lophiostoma macrostomum CBS 122681]|uniref:DUF7730 domain-containing protein n=1 Tax=Lophiostoma macrostomum CBS 122681 TaxID=1314788 RepID=A0A6A6T431_9PLEO|nr:hypothetical protein K491DRAFT_758962 [Lophiostoma macrostomum CBS 122681]